MLLYVYSIHCRPIIVGSIMVSTLNVYLPPSSYITIGNYFVQYQIQPSNEYEPEWSSPKPDINGSFPDLHISQNAPVGTVLISFKVKDDDAGDDGIIKFDVMSTTSGKFCRSLNNPL